MMEINGYEIHTKLGEGGMGSVFLVRNGAGESFALKTLRSDVMDHKEFVERFLRETRIALMLIHPRIVRTFDVGTMKDGIPYMLTEFCPNGDVGSWLSRSPRREYARFLQWLYDAGAALAYAESRNIIHRDLKPANLLLDAGMRLKIADLGMARGTSADATRLTVEGAVIGTPLYMSRNRPVRGTTWTSVPTCTAWARPSTTSSPARRPSSDGRRRRFS